MATAKVIPFLVSAQVVPQEITQEHLVKILELRQQIKDLEQQLEQAQARVMLGLEIGASVEAGLFRASLKIVERRNVSWKSVCERELGEGYCARVLAATKPDATVSLVVSA